MNLPEKHVCRPFDRGPIRAVPIGGSLAMLHYRPQMHFPRNLRWFAIAAAMMRSLAADAATPVGDASGDVLMVQVSPYSKHFDEGPEHTGQPWLVGVEWQRSSRWLAGYSYFNNSFDQKCQYIYGGYVFPLGENYRNWYIKLTGGLIIGYKDPFEDKLPINHNGVAPVIIPGLGYKFDRFNVQLNMLGANGLMITIGYDLLR
jgi:hypothetical protein